MAELRPRSREPSSSSSSSSSAKKSQPPKSIKMKGKNRKNSIKSNIKICVILSILAFLIYIIRSYSIKSKPENDAMKRLLSPIQLPKMTELPMFGGEHRESLYWGTYRPHLYFGVRARTPKSLMAGLMWIGVKDGQYSLKHVCEMSDGLRSYSWLRHDGRNFGHQIIEDQGFKIETTFLKSWSDGSGYGGDWAVRINVNKDRNFEDSLLETGYLFFYITDEAGHTLKLGDGTSKFLTDEAAVSGNREDIGGWELHGKGMDDLQVQFAGFNTHHFHNLTELVQQTLAMQMRITGHLKLPNVAEDSPNFIVFQITRKLPLEVDLVFVSGTDSQDARVQERVRNLSGSQLTDRIKEKKDNFDSLLARTFNLPSKFGDDEVAVGRSAFSNLIGGVGYFYGQSRISVSHQTNVQEMKNALYWPAPLYTAVPSRSVFPRGFLWDEGFHQLVIWRWDIKICLDIIGHWLDLMNMDGWIPREQILGAEALRKVPEEFVDQIPSNANPPSLFLVLHDLVNELNKGSLTLEEKDMIRLFLKRASPRLDAWFQWFNTTQRGKAATSFYWHGRDNMTDMELNPKTLSSGLDDYPRASHPSDDERHVDLRCWMALAADTLYLISDQIGSPNNEFLQTKLQLSNFTLLNKMHYDSLSGMYFDFGNHTEKVSLKWRDMHDKQMRLLKRELRRVVGRNPNLRFVPHFGYVSLFPLIMKIIPSESSVLETQLDLLSNRSLLWTDFGLRSLAKSSSLYMKRNTEHDAPYWRGPVWININYLVLSALNHYANVDGPFKEKALELYLDLRQNVIRNIVDNYKRTGYLWEQYDNNASGKGKGAHPFTGWTSLVVLIMAEKF